jgi:hypothetical protein
VAAEAARVPLAGGCETSFFRAHARPRRPSIRGGGTQAARISVLLLWILVALEDLRPGLTPVSSGGWRPWWWLALPVAAPKALEASASVLRASGHMRMEGSQGIDSSRTTAGRERACVSTPAHFAM